MSYDDYKDELTDVSREELKKFLKWMNEKKGIFPTIIGGWAVYAYEKVLGSKDIDVVMPTDKDLEEVLLKEYFPANGFEVKKDKYFNPKYYVKEVMIGDRPKEIIVDVFIGKFSKEDEENLGIKFHWETVLQHQELKRIDGLSLYVPKIEVLIVLKVIAALERMSKYDRTGDSKLPSKIWKDYHDIAVLIKSNTLNKEFIDKSITEADLKRHIDRFLDGYHRRDYNETILKRRNLTVADIRVVFYQ